MRLYQSHNLYVRSKLQAIHIVFLFMRALNLDRSVCSAAKNLAQEVIHTCNAQGESIRQVSCLMTKSMGICCSCISVPVFT